MWIKLATITQSIQSIYFIEFYLKWTGISVCADAGKGVSTDLLIGLKIPNISF